MENLHVTLFGKKGAEAWTRHAYNVRPECELGWTPYRVLVTSHGGTLAYKAFHTISEFRRWLKASGRTVKLSPHHATGYRQAWVARFGTVEEGSR